MLSADDAALAARHPHLPGLAAVLNPAAVAAAAAAALPSLRVVAARPTYVRFKPATSCLVGYQLTLGSAGDGGCGADGAVDAYVRTVADPDAKLAKAVTVAGQCPGRTSAALIDERTVLLVHPADHDLPVLARLSHPEQRRHVLARALDVDPSDGWQLTRLRYKPERRWVGLLTDTAAAPLLLKVRRPREHRAALHGARAFARTGVPVSRLAGSSDRHSVTLHRWVPGTVADEVIAEGGPAAELATAAVGALLAQVHRVAGPQPVRQLGAADEGAALSAGVAALSELHPSAGALAERIAASLDVDVIGGGGAAPRLLHGDFSVDQVVLGVDGPVLIDVDRATWGDPHSDLGQLLADLALRQVTGEIADDAPYAAAVLDGYTAAGGVIDHRRLAAFAAARLLRLASEPFRRRSDGWADALDALVDRAAALTHQGVNR